MCVCVVGRGATFLLLVFDFSPSSKNFAAVFFFSPACGSVILLLLFPLYYSSRLGILSSPCFPVTDAADAAAECEMIMGTFFFSSNFACFSPFFSCSSTSTKIGFIFYTSFSYSLLLLLLLPFPPFQLLLFSSLPFLYLDTHPPSLFSPSPFFTKPSSPSSERNCKSEPKRDPVAVRFGFLRLLFFFFYSTDQSKTFHYTLLHFLLLPSYLTAYPMVSCSSSSQ